MWSYPAFRGLSQHLWHADSVICPRGLLYLRYSRAWSWEAIQFEWRWKTRIDPQDRRKQKHITDRRVVSARRGGFVDLQSKSSEDQGWRWIDSNEKFPSFVLTSYYDYVTNLNHLLKPLKKLFLFSLSLRSRVNNWPQVFSFLYFLSFARWRRGHQRGRRRSRTIIKRW